MVPSPEPMLEPGTMGRIVLSAITRFRDRFALRDDTQAWTYAQLGNQIARAIAVLRDAGLRQGQGMAMLASNRNELVAVEFAAMLIGVRYTPLHPLAARDTHITVLNDAEATVFVVDPKVLRCPLDDIVREIPSLKAVFAFGQVEGSVDIITAMHRSTPIEIADEARPTDLVRLLYTGGTTGRPKGVMIPHRTMVMATILQSTEWEIPAHPQFLALTPVSHASGAIVPTVLMQGGTVRLTDGFSAEKFCRIVASEKISMTFLVPTMIYVLLDYLGIGSFDLSSLRTLVYGGSPMAPGRLLEGLRVFGSIFVQLYGQTEVPNCIMTLRKDDHDPAKPDRLKSCGLPTPLIQVSLRDAQDEEVNDGEPGEICVRGPLLSNGYWKRPEIDEVAFRGGWMHTGDIAVCGDGGFYSIVDRASDLIISGGFNVYPSEVEEALLSHPDVATVAVVGVSHEKWGEAVTAFVVLEPGCVQNESALKAHVKELKGSVWAPKSIHFVESITLTAIGKIDRKALRQTARSKNEVD